MSAQGSPLLAEDLVLVLFEPKSGTIAGEGTLFYTLAGAVLTDLALAGNIEIAGEKTLTGRKVTAVADRAPTDPILRQMWDKIADKPRGAQSLLAGVGPYLRTPVLDRLVERGDIVTEQRKFLRIFKSTALMLGENSRRDALVKEIRAVLVDGADPDPHSGALAALVSASGSLPSLHREIPWSGDVYKRGKELEQGDWGADAVNEAVLRTAAAIATSSLVVAASVASTQ